MGLHTFIRHYQKPSHYLIGEPNQPNFVALTVWTIAKREMVNEK